MGFNDIVANLGAAAEKLVPLVAGEKGEAAVEIAKGLISLGQKVKEVLSEDEAAPLAARLDQLQASVTAKANATSAGLRGN